MNTCLVVHHDDSERVLLAAGGRQRMVWFWALVSSYATW
jgi:hypothetical protein